MNRTATIPLGRILGIPIDLDYSWFLIFGLLTWTLAVGYYPEAFPYWPTWEYWVLGAITAIMLFVSVLLHELGHSVIAMQYRIPVHRITLFIFGGVAQIGAQPPRALAEFWIAVAGPAVSLLLAVVFFLLRSVTAPMPAAFALVTYLALINAALFVFNLIPGFPLDGGRVFRAILWGVTRNFARATAVAATVGRFIGFFFIFLGVWQVIVAGRFIDGLWIAFIGWFLESAAASEAMQPRYQAFQRLVAAHKVADAMNRSYPQAPGDATLQEVVDSHVLSGGQRCFVVSDGFAGLLTLHRIKEVPRPQWPTTTVRQAMIPAADVKHIAAETGLWTALREMDADGVNQLPVLADGRVLGLLTREGVIGFLRTLEELQR